MTIPNLNSTTADKEKITKVKKVYAQFNEALDRAQAVYGPVDEWYSNGDVEQLITKVPERMMEFMKVSKNCGTSADEGCFSSRREIKHFLPDEDSVDGLNLDEYDISSYKFVLSDGTSIGTYLGIFYFVNIDPKATPVYGKNVFAFTLCSKDLLTYVGAVDTIYASACSGQTSISSKLGNDNELQPYADWIIQHGNMDYLKADASGKCNDSDIVLDGTTNTSCQ